MHKVSDLWQVSEVAESAIRDIRLTLHEYARARRVPEGSELGRFSSTLDPFNDRPAQLAVASTVAIVEHYAERALLDAGCRPKKIRTWPDKVNAWNATYGAEIETACPSFVPVRGYYEARTGIVHRQGELTDSQRNPEVLERLKAAGIARVQYGLIITGATVVSCADTCALAVEELDATRNAKD